jgi:hypothetical protein
MQILCHFFLIRDLSICGCWHAQRALEQIPVSTDMEHYCIIINSALEDREKLYICH